MPPVKGTRKRHASTRAAMTARPPGRLTVPDVRTEQITTPVLPSSAHTGTISLNLEALTASISVAVHQAVQSALIRASTFAGRPLIHVSPSQVPETLVSQAIESEVSPMISSEGQVTIINEGTGSRPATEFRNMAISLAARVSSKMKAKF